MNLSRNAILACLVFETAHSFQSGTPFISRHSGLVQNKKIPFRKTLENTQFNPTVSSTTLNEGNPFQSLVDSIFKPQVPVEPEPEKPKIPDCVVDSDYKLAAYTALIGPLIIVLSPAKYCTDAICPPSIFGAVVGGIFLLLASLFFVQAGRVRFVFDETAFELKVASKKDDSELKATGENIVVGGANRWSYDTFVNWEFFPSIDVPILVYFKETQTPSEKWNEGPGTLDKVGGGQLHFFPVIANAKQLKEQFELRGCAKVVKE